MARTKMKPKLDSLKSGATDASDKAKSTIAKVKGPSPNPATNLILADIALRGGGRLLRHAVERTLLGTKYSPKKAHAIVSGRGMAQTLLGTAVARIATRSVPGALIVGGALLAKTIYDHRKGPAKAKAEGEAQIEEVAQKGREETRKA